MNAAFIKESLQLLLPSGVSSEALAIDPTLWGNLTPVEQELLANANSAKRKAEFATGRMAARLALRKLPGREIDDSPLLKGKRGEVVWPAGVIGSISHCQHFAIAAAAEHPQCEAIGIDIECLKREVSDRVADRFCSAEDKAWIEEAPPGGESQRRLVLFSAKESAFKRIAGSSQGRVNTLIDISLEPLLAELPRFVFKATTIIPSGTPSGAGSRVSVNSLISAEHIVSCAV